MLLVNVKVGQLSSMRIEMDITFFIYQLVYKDFNVLNLLLAHWDNYKYIAILMSQQRYFSLWASKIFIAGLKGKQHFEYLEILID